MNELLREFLLEADDLIEALFADIEELGRGYEQGSVRRKLIGRIFRHVHTIKGTAAAAELPETCEVAHEFETLLDAVRLGRVRFDTKLSALFNDAAAAIAQTLGMAARGERPAAQSQVIVRLKTASSAQTLEEINLEYAERAIKALPPDVAKTLSQYEHQKLREAVTERAGLYLIAVDFDLATFDDSFRSLSTVLSEVGELISTLPGLEASSPDKINFRIVVATIETQAQLAARTSLFQPLSVQQLLAPRTSAGEDGESDSEQTQGQGDGESVSAGHTTGRSASLIASVVRVELNELDGIIAAAHELMTDTISALDVTLATNLNRRERTEIEIRQSRIRRRFIDLEERLVSLRMVPIEQTLARAARAGKVAANSLGLQVDVETIGGEVQLDKSVADAIFDPLLHIIRNSVSHGIETAEERLAAGKQDRGKITIEAIAEGSRVRIKVTDDGRGLDLERITSTAFERGLIAEGKTLTRKESLRLIFRPGFSTTEAVSSVSGRGVGLDVVESAVESVAGDLQVHSEDGKGTTFEIVVPTTLSLVSALVVNSSGYRYAIDANNISEAGFLTPDDVPPFGYGQISWRGYELPVIRLRSLLGQANDISSAGQRLHVVISRTAESEELAGDSWAAFVPRGTAIVVDGWEGHNEVLVRSLGRHAGRWRGISGAAELRDGNVALVLDLPRLLEARGR